ncbi:MAG: insulinase family protein, partial [Candidatus Zambryskibacteria bacterium]|nr:insulinase family protein [Candidatus Zambryskibacteria bacterium]
MHIKNFDPYDFSKKEIDGVIVYYKNLPWAPCINVYIAFNTGAFSDPVDKEGLSHFLEHMIFNGSPKIKDKKAKNKWSKKYALNSWNAWTSFDQTVYYLKCLPENYKSVLIGMKDMIFHPYLRTKDVEHERGVITQEAWRRFKNEKYLSYTKEISNNLYHGHNYSRVSTPLGWPETIAKISQKDIKQWYDEKYAIGNFYIVLTGAVEDKSIELLKIFMKDIPKKSFDKYIKGI